jgi:hypothetical protein
MSDLSTAEITLIARIKTVLESVSNIGLVYDRERWGALTADHRSITVTTIGGSKVMRFWTVSLSAIPDVEEVRISQHGNNVHGWQRTFEYTIEGIFHLNDDDDTETPAKVVVLDVMEELDTDATLNGDYWRNQGAVLEDFSLTQWGADLVHYAKIVLRIESMFT